MGLAIQVTMRWFLLAVALFMMLYRPGAGGVAIGGVLLLIACVTAVNSYVSWRLQTGASMPRGVALGAGFFDAASITTAIGLTDGFRNDSYLFYYPALLAFAVVFGARWSIAYLLLTMPAYALVATTTHDSFNAGVAFDQKRLVVRLATMAVVVLLANLIVRIERHRREEAVAAEAERGQQLLESERRARDVERRAAEERHRLSQEIHDGISQRVYMLTLGLETAKELAARDGAAPGTQERLETLVHSAKQTLLETRHLLMDLGAPREHGPDLERTLKALADEFSSVTSLPHQFTVTGSPRAVSAATAGEIHRIAQEALSNAYRHSGTDRVALSLSFNEAGMSLTVADNGRGLGPGAREGHGMPNMHERARRMGGELHVCGNESGGTSVVLTVPDSAVTDA